MAALTAATTFSVIKKVYSLPLNGVITNAVRIYAGGFCGLPGANALTARRGYLTPWADQVNIQWAGIAESQSWTGGLITAAQTNTAANVNSVLGDTGSTVGINGAEISVEGGPVIIQRAVTGVSAITDVWRVPVYCNTDNQADMSTTASSYSPSIGRVFYWFSSTLCQVYVYGMAGRFLSAVS